MAAVAVVGVLLGCSAAFAAALNPVQQKKLCPLLTPSLAASLMGGKAVDLGCGYQRIGSKGKPVAVLSLVAGSTGASGIFAQEQRAWSHNPKGKLSKLTDLGTERCC